MMTQKLGQKVSFYLAIFVTAFIVGQMIFPFAASLASTPHFNFLPGDYKTLREANASAGETTWHNPVQGSIGDSIAFNVYYHNGVEDTVAHNTKIKVDLGTQAGNSLIVTAHLSADNAAQVTDQGTVQVSGQIPANLTYIPGSSLWYPNQGSTPKPEVQPLPDGVTTTGLNIGDVTGCWEFAGFVVFQAEIVSAGKPTLTIDKKVLDKTAGEVNYVDQNQANPNDILTYKLAFANTGNESATNLIIKDVLPQYVQFVNGTAKLYSTINPQATPVSDTLVSTGVNLGSWAMNTSGYITFDVIVADVQIMPYGNQTLINTAIINSDQTAPLSDIATTLVSNPQPLLADLTLNKLVKNTTKGDATFLKQTTAWPNDELIFHIDIHSAGSDVATNVSLNDILPQYLLYTSGSTKLFKNGQLIGQPDGIIEAGINLGNWQAGETGWVEFKVKVEACPPSGTYQLTNIAKIRANNISEKQSTATISLTVKRPPEPPVLEISKGVANLTKGEINYVAANLAYPEDVLQYQITFGNRGEQTATSVRVLDQLPPEVEFVSGSAMLYFNGGVTALSDAIIDRGVGIPNLAPGQSGYITLKVKVKANLAAGLVLIDTAHIYADCDLHAQDQASTTIHLPAKPEIKGVKALPKTGSSPTTALLFSLIVASIVTLLVYYLKEKKLLAQAIRSSRIIA